MSYLKLSCVFTCLHLAVWMSYAQYTTPYLDIYPRPLVAYERACPAIGNETINFIYNLHGEVLAKLDATRTYEHIMLSTIRMVDLETPSTSGRHMFHSAYKPERFLKAEPYESYFEEMTHLLQNRMGLSYAQVAQCEHYTGPVSPVYCDPKFHYPCPDNPKYRTIDGTCNNLANPSWGSSYTCYRRLLPAAYSDGISSLRSGFYGDKLPNPRAISQQLHGDSEAQGLEYTHFLMQWGQFIAHEISMAKSYLAAGQEVLDCCQDSTYPGPNYQGSPAYSPYNDSYRNYPNRPDLHPQCLPIYVPPGDPFYEGQTGGCLNFVRSAPCASCEIGPRGHTNRVTSYIDASNVYGSTQEALDYLIDPYDPAKLAVQQTGYGYLLPRNRNPNLDQCSKLSGDHMCFSAGDLRNNQHPGLGFMHTMFVRYHNKVVDILRHLNKHWSDKIVFEETRRIVGAQIQFITMREYLHLVIGPSMMSFFDLWTQKYGNTFYASELNAGLFVEVGSAAYRYGHSLVHTDWWLVNRTSGEVYSSYDISNVFFDAEQFYTGAIDEAIMGMTVQNSKRFDPYVTPSLTRYLYRVKGQTHGLDLAAFNIYRSRDHGLQGYTRYLEQCFGVSIRTFHDLLPFMEKGNINRLAEIYRHVQDVDLWTGALHERKLRDAVVGPTFGCLIGLQYYYLKFGDRFYLEHGGLPSSFTDRQLTELRKTWMSKIICDTNDGITFSTLDVFQPPSDYNPMLFCNQIPEIDWNAWIETPPAPYHARSDYGRSYD